MRSGDVDVAIAGGGPAGAAAACVLARAGLRVLLADAGGAHRFKVGEGLPPSARHLLRESGALERILADGHRASHGTLAFWGNDTAHANDYLFQPHGHGLQLDRARFDAALLEHAQTSGAEIMHEAKLALLPAASEKGKHRLHLRTQSHESVIGCRWLIDATGRPATLARALGAARIQHDALLAFHMRLASSADSDQDGRTWVEAVAEGWWYSVLLPSRERLVAFQGDADLVDRRTLLSRDGLWQALARAPHLYARCRQHSYAPTGSPHGADASSSHLDHSARLPSDAPPSNAPGWLAVGDAALAFDPLSSKGISNALYTGMRAAQALVNFEQGDRDALSHYARHLLDIHRSYRQQLGAYYSTERRWPKAPFWLRRSGGVSDAVALV